MHDLAAGEDLTGIPSGQYGFLPVDRVRFGPGSLDYLADDVDSLDAGRALVITTGSISTETPLLQRVRDILGPRLAGTFSGVRQHTPSRTVTAAVEEARRVEADVLISLGGGSVIDAAKATALRIARDSSFLPHISLPTTLSAAEFSPFFGMTDEDTLQKSGANDPHLAPRVVILDVDLADYTPDWLWLGSGVRALDHAVETIYAPNHQPATDALAQEAIRLLFTHLPESTGTDASRSARQQCQIAAWLSFFGVANITLGLSHALGRELGPRYSIPHGYTSAVLLPKVMAYLLPTTAQRQALIALAAGVAADGRAVSEIAREAPSAVFSLVRTLGLPQRLRDLDVPKNDLESLAAGRQDVLHILRDAW